MEVQLVMVIISLFYLHELVSSLEVEFMLTHSKFVSTLAIPECSGFLHIL